jgi:2-polyprenyl-3-methyl-5-hydroxy-6-metoxy-1,4-benzoquinol methylase
MAEQKRWIDEDGNPHQGELIESSKGFDVIECVECGFKHIIPIPTEEFLEDYYKKDFVKNRPKGFYKILEEDYPWQKIFYEEKYALFEKYIHHKNRTILDVGSGLGFFLKTGKERGWDVLGIEPSLESVEYSTKHGIEVKNAYLNKDNYSSFGKFDVIHMHEVIEHLPDPAGIIEIAKKMLNPGGIICLVSPNEFNPLQEAFISNSNIAKWWVAPPEHINYFDFSSIQKLLKNNDFEVIEQTATFPLELFLHMGDNYIGNRDVGRVIHNKRVNIETNLHRAGYEEFRRELNKKFSELGIGREFVVIAKVN